MSLTKPSRPSVYIKNLNKTVFVNFITISDEEWIAEEYPNGSLDTRFRKGDIDAVLNVFWRLLDDDAKRIIVNARIKYWEGMNEVEYKTDDPVKKLKQVVSGEDEIVGIIKAIGDSKIMSLPDRKINEKKKLKVAR